MNAGNDVIATIRYSSFECRGRS